MGLFGNYNRLIPGPVEYNVERVFEGVMVPTFM